MERFLAAFLWVSRVAHSFDLDSASLSVGWGKLVTDSVVLVWLFWEWVRLVDSDSSSETYEGQDLEYFH